jgi:hypothetical protein
MGRELEGLNTMLQKGCKMLETRGNGMVWLGLASHYRTDTHF